jgi:peptidase E
MSIEVIALGGGGFSMSQGWKATALDEYIVTAAEVPKPKVCFLATASGDARLYIDRFYGAYDALNCKPTHLELFERTKPLESLQEADIIFVGGGSTANLLALWRLHGVAEILTTYPRNRTRILSGVSAGALCWFSAGITDSFGPTLSELHDGLGLLAGSFVPHYDTEPTRRPKYLQAIADGHLPAGYAAEDGTALHFKNGALHKAITEHPQAKAYKVHANFGTPEEKTLLTELL